MISNNITPIVKIRSADNELYMKRDDLLPFSFGGNKVRIAEEFFYDMQRKGKNCIIGYGNARSNLSRAIANMAFSKGIPCHIISPADDDGKRLVTGNSSLVNLCNVKFHECTKNNVSETVESVMKECEAVGLSPYYIYGDKFGKGNEATPVEAYVKTYAEIKEQSKEMNLDFDYIFLATGTGMTQAGLLAGQSIFGGNEKIIGISVARDKERESKVLADFLASYSYIKKSNVVSDDLICVEDGFLCDGYGKYNDGIKDIIISLFKEQGIPLDPTYTGKAFYGMTEYLKKNQIKNKKILFVHTGGTPLFFDFIRGVKNEPDVQEYRDPVGLSEFLWDIDNRLPVPLSARVNIEEYSEKVINNGSVLAIVKDNVIASAALFYCNDIKNRKAYLTLLVTHPDHEGHGYANLILKSAEHKAKKAGMSEFHLDTEISNTHAIAFYSNRGYKIKDITGKVHMVKEL